MLWYHLPIRDVGVPGEVWEDAWRIAGAELRALLRDGFHVLVHCKGGLGRAALAAIDAQAKGGRLTLRCEEGKEPDLEAASG